MCACELLECDAALAADCAACDDPARCDAGPDGPWWPARVPLWHELEAERAVSAVTLVTAVGARVAAAAPLLWGAELDGDAGAGAPAAPGPCGPGLVLPLAPIAAAALLAEAPIANWSAASPDPSRARFALGVGATSAVTPGPETAKKEEEDDDDDEEAACPPPVPEPVPATNAAAAAAAAADATPAPLDHVSFSCTTSKYSSKSELMRVTVPSRCNGVSISSYHSRRRSLPGTRCDVGWQWKM